jgi:NitT/TauT family transport system permease protein
VTARPSPARAVLARGPVTFLVSFVVFLAGWEAIVRALEVPPIVVPPPSAVAVALYEGIASGLFIKHFWVTLQEILLGYALGASAGLILGIAIGQSYLLERILYPYVVAFQTIPKVAVAPLFVIWFGYGIGSKVVITAAITFFPVIANTIVGLRSAPRDELEMVTAYTANRWQAFVMVRLPQALPYIFVGLDIAIVLSVIGAIVGEFVGSQAGLGYLIMQMNFNFDIAGVFAILVILSALGVSLHLIVKTIRRRVVFWMRELDGGVTGA